MRTHSRRRRTAALLLAAAPIFAAAQSTPAGQGVAAAVEDRPDRVDVRRVFRIEDDRVTESSGFAISRTRPGLAYTVNDSGDAARVLVIAMDNGAVVGETRLTGVQAVDVEALAPAPGGRLVVADIGDNGAERDSVELYVIDEPRRGATTDYPVRVTLTYPGRPVDAEAAVVVGRRLYVVTKEVLGGTVFAAPVFMSTQRRGYVLRRVGPAPTLVTDGTRLEDGSVVLRDYYRAYLLRLPSWRVTASYPLPRVEQGETVAASPGRRAVYVGSEGEGSPVFMVRFPAQQADGRQAPSRTSPTPGPSEEAPNAQADTEHPRARPPGYVVAVVAALAVTILVGRYRRRGGR
ncbi:MAG: hypothetical protein ACRDOY_08260 [Nocardioidaceae bacterium]